jgi:hypothetical protein
MFWRIMIRLSSSKAFSIDACQVFKVITDYDEGKSNTVSTHAEGGVSWAASHGLVAGATFPRVAARGAD